MPFKTGLSIGDVIQNTRLCEIFLCSEQGGMRRSHRTKTLVIVSDHVGSPYGDNWREEIFLHWYGTKRGSNN